MRTLNNSIWTALLTAAAFMAPAGSEAAGLGKDKNLETQESTYSIQSSNEGIGADQQDAVSRAASLVQSDQFAEAEKLLDRVLSNFAGLMNDNTQTYVSFRDDNDYKQYLKELQAKQGGKSQAKVTRVHDSFTHALQLTAYIASSQQQWGRAMEYLDRKISYAPYEAQPHLEKGYILTAQGRPAEGLESYKKAYQLAVAHHAAKQERAAALRGMGSSLIELDKLDEAEDSFNKSLEIEPGNRIALAELEYIKKLRAQSR